MMDQQPVASAVVVATPDTGSLISLGGTQHTFKFLSADTGGQFALMEATIQPHTLVIPHMHTNEDELAFAVEGEAGFRIGDQEFRVGPGSYIFIPPGTPHALWNDTDTPAKGISIYFPAGLETYFEEMGEVFAASNPPDFSKLGVISRKYGIISNMEWVPELCAKYGLELG